MSESLRNIVAMNIYNEDTQQWEEPALSTTAEAVETADGSNVEVKLAAIPGAIESAINALKDGVATEGDTLKKLLTQIQAIQTAIGSDDVDLDTLQEVVDYIKANKDALTLLGGNKVNISDVVNDLATETSGKVLDARAGKALKDLIDTLQTSVSGLQTQAGTLATKAELNAVKAGAVPVISETAPANPVNGQIWYKPISTT